VTDRAAGPGPIALVGSGEFLPVMEEIDSDLLAGRAPRAAFLPTAAAEEGPDRLRYWVDLGTDHFRRLGVEPVPVLVLDRPGADDPSLTGAIAGAGLVYLSGGNPGFLAATLRDTAVWRAIVDAWRAGAALAGCSAGAAALTAVAGNVRDPSRGDGRGLGLVPHMGVIPHFDRIEAWRPGLTARIRSAAPPGTTVVGIDEETALVGGPERWRVRGARTVTVFSAGPDADGRAVHAAGEDLVISPAAS